MFDSVDWFSERNGIAISPDNIQYLATFITPITAIATAATCIQCYVSSRSDNSNVILFYYLENLLQRYNVLKTKRNNTNRRRPAGVVVPVLVPGCGFSSESDVYVAIN